MAFYGNLSFPRHWLHLQITQPTPLLAASKTISANEPDYKKLHRAGRIFELSEGTMTDLTRRGFSWQSHSPQLSSLFCSNQSPYIADSPYNARFGSDGKVILLRA